MVLYKENAIKFITKAPNDIYLMIRCDTHAVSNTILRFV